uniref:Gag polyprotein n=1 Tax=Feline immunodeficiency virus TaxID=11673 RepID=A3R3J8_9RETR|nr:gag protein [Feline immunodeficiency virus]
MGNEQGKETKAAIKRCCGVAVGPGSKSNKYGPGNIRWAIRMANVSTGRDPGLVPENIDSIRILICDLVDKRDRYGGNKEIDAAIKTLKVLAVVGILNMKASTTQGAENLFKIMGLEERPSEKQAGKEEEEPPSAYCATSPSPAKVNPIQITNGQAHYVPMSPRLVSIFMEKARDGLGSEECILWFTAFSPDLTPTDMAHLIMSAPGCAADKEIIDSKLKELTREYERTHPEDGPRPLPYFTAREIMGVDVDQNIQAQPAFHPARVQARDWYIEALKHLQNVKSGAPKAVQMKQGVKEPYQEFVDRLLKQIDLEQNSPEVRLYLKQSLSITNANSECKRAMTHLKPDSPLEEKLRACQDIGTNTHKMQMLAETFAALQVKTPWKTKNRNTKSSFKCYNCGKPGHLARACRAPKKCNNCGKFGHVANQCRNKNQGNWKQGKAAAPNNPVQQYSAIPSAPPMENVDNLLEI